MVRILCGIALFTTVTSALAADPVAVPREFRGVWVATVANIDWPSKPGLSAEAQKKELVALFDRCQAMRLNAVVFQVRPMCDALYESPLEPWSSFLTGKQGQNPGYDPLTLAIELAHSRGMELHAWLNPYRAWQPSAKGEPAENHITKTRPDIAKKYGKHSWLNPTHPDTAKHSLEVVKDLVRRYDLDGIHMDDYFYPYVELDAQKNEIPFPDDDTWATYQKAGGALKRDDWRRDAVNRFVKSMYQEVHQIKPWVKVGLSPFGIWRPGHPVGIQGFDQYAKLYADAKLWWNEGWVDYFTPQLYWAIQPEKQSYPKLMNWWAAENTKVRHLWVGNSAGRHPPQEIEAQVELTRGAKATGNVWFSEKALRGEKAKTLGTLYKNPALPPETTWLKDEAPGEAVATLVANGHLEIGKTNPHVRFVVVQEFTQGTTTVRILGAQTKGSIKTVLSENTYTVKVTLVNRVGAEGKATSLKVK